MDLTAAQLTATPQNPRLSAPLELAQAPGQSTAPAADSARAQAAQKAGAANALTAALHPATGLYNQNAEPRMETTVWNYCARFGDGFADQAEAARRVLKANAHQGAAGADQALRDQFEITGKTHLYDKAEDRFAPGRFIATAQGPGFVLRFDSAKALPMVLSNRLDVNA